MRQGGIGSKCPLVARQMPTPHLPVATPKQTFNYGSTYHCYYVWLSARVFASLAPPMYLNVYSFGRPRNSCQARPLLNIKDRGLLVARFLPSHLPLRLWFSGASFSTRHSS